MILNLTNFSDYQQRTASSEASHDFISAIDRLLQANKEKIIWKFQDEGIFLDFTRALHDDLHNMLSSVLSE